MSKRCSVSIVCLVGSLCAQTDPGPRAGAAGAGSYYPMLNVVEQRYFGESLAVFQEIDSVSGKISGEEGSGLGPTFNGNSCAMCHAVEGTPAASNVGPTLTHLASRLTLGSGVLPNTRGSLAGWVVDPQQIKPAARMPPSPLPPADLEALLDYLGSLR